MKHLNIVELKEMLTVTAKDVENEAECANYESKEVRLGDIFMVFEFVPYDLSGLLKHADVVS